MSNKQKSIFVKLKDPPSFELGIMKPIYHSKDGNCAIMFIDDDPSNPKPPGIWQYNLDKQIVTNKYEKPPNLQLESWRYCIDRENDIVYIMGGGNYIFASLNLNTNQWNILQNDAIYQHYDYTVRVNIDNCYFMPSPINELHIMCHDHFKYDNSNDTLVKFNNDTSLFRKDEDGYHESAEFLYCKSMQRLFMFQFVGNEILYCDMNENDEKISDWRKYEMSLPREYEPESNPANENCEFLLAFDQILFFCDYRRELNDGNDKDEKTENSRIWCLDLKNNDKWYPSPQIIDTLKGVGELIGDGKTPCMMRDDENNVHIMAFREGNNFHYKTSLFEMLPNEIITMNRKECHPLVFGYIRNFEKKQEMILPSDLKRLILEFYPIFSLQPCH